RFAHGRTDLHEATSLEALGLSSLEHVELLMALEQQFETTVDEMAFAMARTVGDLRPLVGRAAPDAAAAAHLPAAQPPTRPDATEVSAVSAAGTDAPERPALDGPEGPQVAGSESRSYQALVFPKW